ncbi:MAG TPA: hypothetical protein DIS96_01940, partial [Pusillimonas sp.]|nr:hypothetical protein [Pusillimonas sp.]
MACNAAVKVVLRSRRQQRLSACFDNEREKLMTTESTPRYGNEAVAPNVSLYYQYFESQQPGPCTVLMHSLAMDHSFWRSVAPALAKEGPVLCVDLRGHGRSSKPQGPYSIAGMAADVRTLLDHLKIDQVIVA